MTAIILAMALATHVQIYDGGISWRPADTMLLPAGASTLNVGHGEHFAQMYMDGGTAWVVDGKMIPDGPGHTGFCSVLLWIWDQLDWCTRVRADQIGKKMCGRTPSFPFDVRLDNGVVRFRHVMATACIATDLDGAYATSAELKGTKLTIRGHHEDWVRVTCLN